ncbi:MAG: hypothetical protein R2873_07020 [Caldilineaceae bacterium]|nr:hypothetical protein [Caldilineaceae bacterium]
MNLERLKQAEADFLAQYPGGFDHPEMAALGRKHKMDKMVELAQEGFARDKFRSPALIVENMVKVVSRASMVSVFEKPKFRDYARALTLDEMDVLSTGLKEILYGPEDQGFEKMLAVLKEGSIAKWPLMTICQTYFRPDVEVFVKPTTVKGVIERFELKHLQYKPTPSWAFYAGYRDAINEMKRHVDPSLSPSNAAFSGFLMMAMEQV